MYDNSNSGFLRRNLNRASDDSPSHLGNCQVLGVEYWLTAKPSPDEKAAISCLATPKDKECQLGPVAFVLRPNEKYPGSKRPDYVGEFDGIDAACWINVMRRDTAKMKTGEKYLSIKFTPPTDGVTEATSDSLSAEDDNEIPF